MIIKKIIIENYLCYYGIKEFDLSEGLNIIVGENGEGKTKFFEAIDWLLNGDSNNLELLISAKALNEVSIGEVFRVKVLMEVIPEYGGTASISKSFIVKKSNNGDSIISNYIIEGVERNNIGERSIIDGKTLLERIFPFEIRKYSLFKGESDLEIFKSEAALSNLINLFSDAKHYDKYSTKGEFLRLKSETAVATATKNIDTNKNNYELLEREIKRLEDSKYDITVHLNITEEEIIKVNENLEDAEQHVKNAEALKTINEKIFNIEDKIKKCNSHIDENYTTALFDEKWFLVHFEPIQRKFAEKITNLSQEKRRLQSDFDKKKGIKEGERKAKMELLNNVIPLPIGVPSKAHLEEMLKDEVCKVCNRPVEKDSEPYKFMIKRLEEYIQSQKPDVENEEEKVLFEHNYINRLESLSISHEDNLKQLRSTEQQIKDWFLLNEKLKVEINELEEQLVKQKEERNKILGNSSLAAEKLSDVLKNYNAWQKYLLGKEREKLEYSSKLHDLDIQLHSKRTEKDGIDLKSAHSFLIKTRDILRDIETIFKDTKQNKFNEFIEKLQLKSNSIFSQINIDSFTGIIKFTKKKRGDKDAIEIELQENGRVFYKPNQSLLTSMYISILFAISELSAEVKERYPMIFDAPTSSFGESKTSEFLNLIHETKGQKILLIKDFLITNKETRNLEVKKEFQNVKRDKAFWIRLQRPFNKQNLTTLNTEIITL